ncbi:hypothetical protein QBC36DRAFT_335773 [Triangularia setosa]|uniref:Uncharacterized protein n=1 Tax=Triangularia setosa TaxID=2587417 RepID=A0AAN7A4Y7_9PEZI|nr:hypothetical protein QBC36DRAFT_335773 [Podospora setosa]
MALPISSIMMPRACLATIRPLQRIFIERSTQARLPPLHRHQPQQVRHYQYSTGEAKRLFTDEEIPPLEAWQRLEKDHGLRTPPGITIDRMYEVVRLYCTIATNKTVAWRARFQSEFGIEPIDLHYAAITLFPITDQKLCMHMLATASAMGYNPSTVSLIKLLTRIDKYFEARLQQPFRDVEARFKLLAKTTRDPDILTIQGLMALREKNEDAALRFFQQAITAADLGSGIMPPLLPGDTHLYGSPDLVAGRPLRFSYEKSCYYKLGQLLKKKGQLDEARKAFQVAAKDLRHVPALVEHARMVPLGQTAENNKYRERVLASACTVLNVEALRQMVVDLLMKYENPEKYSPKEFKEDPIDVRVVWEWCLLGLSWGKAKFPFTNREEFEGVQKAIWSNRARISLVRQNADSGEVSLTIWVYPSRLPKLGNPTAEPEQFDITI